MLANLYEFPNVDGKLTKQQIAIVLKDWSLEFKKMEQVGSHHHIFSHVEWDMIGYKVLVEKVNQEFIWVERQELFEKYAIPTAFSMFRDRIK